MKAFFTAMFLVALGVFTLLPSQSFAQAPDTMVVAALPPGNLNRVINGDTTATGERNNPNRVYVLQQTTETDTTYYLTNEILVKDLTLVGKINPTTGYIPLIAPFINPDGSSPEQFFTTEANGTVHLVNLYCLGRRVDTTSVTYHIVFARFANTKIIAEHCVFEGFGETLTPNLFDFWNAGNAVSIVDHCLFLNNQSSVPQNPGQSWSGPNADDIDTLIVTNSTYMVMGGNVVGSPYSVGYLKFDHNTFFMHTKSSPFSLQGMANAYITNNIFYSCYSAGLDSNHAFNPQVYNANFFSPPAIFTLDSVDADGQGNQFAAYGTTEENRIIEVNNNAYWWPQGILDNFDTMNSDPIYRAVGGRIYAPTFLAVNPGAEAVLNDPHVVFADNDSTDPGFDADLVAEAVDAMVSFVRDVWANGGTALGPKPFIDPVHPTSPFAGVPADWQTTQGYPVPNNLRYSATLTGSDGLPLGDLTWWPEITTGVEQINNSVPAKYTLSQNYPNPFNPTTNIKYSIPQSGFVTLKVYNMLGQEVATLVNQQQKVGEYNVDFDASNLASGVYMYRIQAGNVTLTKKMLLLK